MPERVRETDIGAPIVAYLEQQGWDVYQEVKAAYGDPIADVVGVMEHGRARVVWVVECKTTLGLAVLDQALGWLGFAHYVSVAVPPTPCRSRHRAVDYLLKQNGIGWLSVALHDPPWPPEVNELQAPRLHRKAYVRKLLDALNPAQKHLCPAGSTAGAWTPFRQTCDALAREAKAQPGITLKAAVDAIRTHYHSTQTARSCLVKWLGAGKVRGVEGRIEGGMWKLYPKESIHA